MRLTEEQYRDLMARRGLAANSLGAPAVKAKPKYGNRKVTDGEGNVHDSTKEYRRWQELEERARRGEITRLRRQVPFACVVNGILVCQYIADACYDEGAATIVEDTKSEITRKKPEYRIKLKLMQAIHGIQIREV
jgi:hypothetical protein